MPTDHTKPVKDGTVTNFNEFAWSCARAFGPLVTLRDDNNATIPVAFKPSPYYTERLNALYAELDELREITPEMAEEKVEEIYRAAMTGWKERRERNRVEQNRYQDMLLRVYAWTPPTPDHLELKNFMVSQLEDSIGLDCGYDIRPPVRLPGCVWLSEKYRSLRESLKYAAEDHYKEGERTRERNAWIQALRTSIGEPPVKSVGGKS